MPRAIPLLFFLLLASPSPAAPPQAAETGTVRGTFLSLDRVKTKGDTSERDVVLFLEPKKPVAVQPPAEPVVVRQENLAFRPHVLAVVAGTKVRFENADAVVHNVFSSDACCPVNLDMPAQGRHDLLIAEAGVASVVCRLHPDMTMFVVALDTPWLTQIELEKIPVGEHAEYRADYAIQGVPPGEYVLSFWSKKLAPQKIDVVVAAGEVTTQDVTIEKP